MHASEIEKASPHDIMVAWQNEQIGYRQAMRLIGCSNLFELYEACRSSGVPLRIWPTAMEAKASNAALADILATGDDERTPGINL